MTPSTLDAARVENSEDLRLVWVAFIYSIVTSPHGACHDQWLVADVVLIRFCMLYAFACMLFIRPGCGGGTVTFLHSGSSRFQANAPCRGYPIGPISSWEGKFLFFILLPGDLTIPNLAVDYMSRTCTGA